MPSARVDDVLQLIANPQTPGRRVAELGSLSSGAKMAMKIFVKRVITIFATNAYIMQYIPCNSALLAKETLFLTLPKNIFAQSHLKTA